MRASGVLSRYAVLILLVVMIAIFSILSPQGFFSVGNFVGLANSYAVGLVLTLGLLFPLMVGEFDLSIAYGLGFGGILTGFLDGQAHWPIGVVIVVVLVIGGLVGVVNAFFVVVVGVNSLIVTLGMGSVLYGLTLLVSNGQILSNISPALTQGVNLTPGTPNLPLYLAIAAVLGVWYVIEYTPLGRYLTFIGLGPEVARLAGLPVRPLRFATFVIAGVVAAACGVLTVGQLGAADPSVGAPFLLQAFAAAFLGTTVIKLGRFNAVGTAIAVAFSAVGVGGLTLLVSASWLPYVFNGAALVIAVTFSQLSSRGKRT